MEEAIELKPVKKGKLAISLLSILAVIFICLSSLFVYIDKKDAKYYKKTTATITSMVSKHVGSSTNNRNKKTYDVYVDFVVDGENYKHIKLNLYKGSMDIGDKVDILYDTRNPNKIKYDSFMDPFALTFGIIALCFILSILIILKVLSMHTKSKLRLKEMEAACKARIINITRNNKHMYLKCKYGETIFVSDNYRFNENIRAGYTVDLYIDKVAFAEAKMLSAYSERKIITNTKVFYLDPNSVEYGMLDSNEDYEYIS